MALKGQYQNPHRQDEILEDAYLKISECFTHDPFTRVHTTTWLMYYSEEDRDGDNPAKPIDSGSLIVQGEDFDTYFDEEVLKEAGRSIKTQEYTYLKTIQPYNTWQDC